MERKPRAYKLQLLQVREARGPNFNSPDAVADIFGAEVYADQEQFWVLDLNVRNKLIEKRLTNLGTLDMSVVHPRDVFKGAILNSAASVILVHNHPSGDTEPSDEDVKLTKRLVECGNLLGITVLDHIIVAPLGSNPGDGTKFISLKNRNLF